MLTELKGYKVTPKGQKLLKAAISGRVAKSFPGNTEELFTIANVLLYLVDYPDEIYFSYDPEDDDRIALVMKQIEYLKWIEPSAIPRVESYLHFQEFKRRHKGNLGDILRGGLE